MVKLDLNKVAEESDEEITASPVHTPPTHNVQIVSPSRNLVMSTPIRRKLILESPTGSPYVTLKETPSNFKIPPDIPPVVLFGQEIHPATTPPPHTTSPCSVPNSQDIIIPPKKRKILTPNLATQQLSTVDSGLLVSTKHQRSNPMAINPLQTSRESMVDDQSNTTSPANKTVSSSEIILNSPLTPPTVSKNSLIVNPDSSLVKILGLSDPTTGKNGLIEPMYKWACRERCKVQSLAFLKSNDIKVSLQVKCMACRKKCNMWLKLDAELKKILGLLSKHKYEVPVAYVSDKTKQCPMCKVKTVMEPVEAKKKRNTNWLGLLLAHELNSLNFDRLVYFCRQRGLKWGHSCSKSRLMHLCMRDLVDQLGVNAPQGSIC